MNRWLTHIYAIDPITGIMTEYLGPVVSAPTQELAFEWCQNNGLGYCHIGDRNDSDTDMNGTKTDYDKIAMN